MEVRDWMWWDALCKLNLGLKSMSVSIFVFLLQIGKEQEVWHLLQRSEGWSSYYQYKVVTGLDSAYNLIHKVPGWFTGYFGWWVACQLTRALSPSWWVPGRGCPTWCLRGRGWCWAGCSSAPAGRRAPHCWWWGWVTTSGRRWRRLPRQATTAASGPGGW